MAEIEALFHRLDKEHSAYRAETSTILADHTIEIKTLRTEVKDLTALVYTKFEGMWLKIFGIVSGIVGAAVLIGQFFL